VNGHGAAPGRERGIALVSSLLLLIIITILALSMFRSFVTQQRIAGNLREKERALHAAESAQQYAEWWLLQGNNTAIGATACANGTLVASPTAGQICNQTAEQQLTFAAVAQPPWAIQTTYQPPNMTLVGGNANNQPYFAVPAYYIADRGVAADGAGEAYQIDAYGYGSAATTVAVVESTYEVQQGVVNRGGL
jgi:type IV pilus assembly protein PilX